MADLEAAGDDGDGPKPCPSCFGEGIAMRGLSHFCWCWCYLDADDSPHRPLCGPGARLAVDEFRRIHQDEFGWGRGKTLMNWCDRVFVGKHCMWGGIAFLVMLGAAILLFACLSPRRVASG